MIYFARLDSGLIKIGCTGNLHKRIKDLRHFHESVDVIATMSGGRDVEKETHARFAHLRVRRTEKFREGPDLMEFIAGLDRVDAQPVPPKGSMRCMINMYVQRADLAQLDGMARELNGTRSDALRHMLSLARDVLGEEFFKKFDQPT